MRAANENAVWGHGTSETTLNKQREFTPDDQLVGITIRKIANAGHAVQQGQSGDFLVSKWGLSRYCADLPALQAFARQIGVRE